MTQNQSNNKRIAKNAMFLYIRMILIMGVNLYMSRVILDKLGVDDYGVYNMVGGVVGMLSFLSGTLSIGTSRFITIELGRKNIDKLIKTFSTAFYTHLGLGVIMSILLDTFGLYFVYTQLTIPSDRLDAAFIVYQISILTMLIAITQVPYTSAIMAHEKMGIYAYVSIFEAFGKLGVLFLLDYSPLDKLVFYAILLGVIQFAVALVYRIYCKKQFIEATIRRIFDKSIFKNMMSFSGWNLMANVANVIGMQAVIVVMGMFFAPAIVGAQAFATQIATAIMQFVNNFRSAINPQIIKLYASGEREKSKQMTLRTTIYVYELVLVLGLPTIFVMNKLLDVWLVQVPAYAVVFAQWIIIKSIVGTFDASFYTPMMASGKVKSNSIVCTFTSITQIVLLYIILKFGGSVMWVQYLSLINISLFSFFIKPIILCKDIDYKASELLRCFLKCLQVTIITLVLPVLSYIFLNLNNIWHNLLMVIITVLSVVITSYITLEITDRVRVTNLVLSKIRKRNGIAE